MTPFLKVVENPLEIHLQKRAAELNIAPPIFDTNNTSYMVMQDLDEMCIADKYGPSPSNVPSWVWAQIYFILNKLYKEGNMEYIDITPYNFIEKDGVVWCIDYGHASPARGPIRNWFLKDLLEKKLKRWNPDFA
jgi:hypothetical protein